MKLSKQILSLLLALVLTVPLFTLGAGAGSVVFVAIDETLPFELSSASMPFWEDGVLYVSSSVFENSSLGVYSSYDKTEWIYSLYNSTHQLDFYLTMSACYDIDDNYYPYKALTRNNGVFVPCAFVCAFFGLGFSYITDYTDYPIARVTTGRQVYGSTEFAYFASSIISSRASAYLGTGQTPTGGGTSTPAPEEPPKPPAPPPNKSIMLRLEAGRSDVNTAAASVLSELSFDAAFFFGKETGEASSDCIADIWGRGFALGLSARTLEDLRLAGDIVSSKVWFRPRLAGCPEEGIKEKGYIPIGWDIDADAAVTAPGTLNTGEDIGRALVLKIDLGAHTAEETAGFLWYLKDNGYTVYPLDETFGQR